MRGIEGHEGKSSSYHAISVFVYQIEKDYVESVMVFLQESVCPSESDGQYICSIDDGVGPPGTEGMRTGVRTAMNFIESPNYVLFLFNEKNNVFSKENNTHTDTLCA